MSTKKYELLALALRYWFIFIFALLFFVCLSRTIKDILFEDNGKRSIDKAPFLIVFLVLSAFALLSFHEPNSFDTSVMVLGALIAAVILFQFYFFYFLFKGLDNTVLIIVDTLSVMGFIMLYRLTPELAFSQVEWFAIGNILLFIFIFISPRIKESKVTIYFLMILGTILLLLVFFFGKESGGALSKLPIGKYSIQPSEFIKIILIFITALYLNIKKNFVQKVPLFAFAIISVLIVVIQKDLGSALHYFMVFLFMYYIGSGDWLLTAIAIVAGVVASFASYYIFPHVRIRIQAWQNPWSDVNGQGYQVAQSLMAIGSGGLFGAGLGLGKPYIIPAARTDFIFACICEEFGVIVGGVVIGFFILLLFRGMMIAFNSQSAKNLLLASGATISLALQAFTIIGGVIKFIPLTGVTLPFVSYGGSSMLVSLSLAGIIQGIAIRNYTLSEESLDDLDDIVSDKLEGDDDYYEED